MADYIVNLKDGEDNLLPKSKWKKDYFSLGNSGYVNIDGSKHLGIAVLDFSSGNNSLAEGAILGRTQFKPSSVVRSMRLPNNGYLAITTDGDVLVQGVSGISTWSSLTLTYVF